MKKQVAMLLCGSLAVSMLISGCKKKDGELGIEDYKNMYNAKVTEVSNLSNQLDSVKRLLYTYDPTLADVQDLTDFTILPTGKTAYIQLNDIISFNSKLDMGQSVVVPNQSRINITNSVFISPSENWTFGLGNGSCKMSHVNDIYAEMEVYSYNGQANAYSVYDEIIKPHLQSVQAEELTQKVIFLGTNAGTLTESRVYVIVRTDKETGEVTRTMEIPPATTAAETSPVETSEAETNENGETVPTSEAETTATETTVAETSPVESSKEETSPAEPIYETDENGETVLDENGSPVTVEQTETEPETEEELPYDEVVVPYRYVCGVAIGDYSDIPDALVFKFFYPESSNIVSSTEVINTMLKSVVMGNNYLTLE